MICPTFFSRGFALSFLLIFASLRLQADPSSDLATANEAYSAGHYEESARILRDLTRTQGYSADVCFNLGNAEAKAGHLGHALLAYERARYLAPSDPEIDHNLQLVRKQAGLDSNSFRWWQVLLLSINWTFWMALITLCLALLLVALVGTRYAGALAPHLGLGERLLQNIFRGIFFVCIPLAMVFGFVELSVVGFSHRLEGVVVAPKGGTLLLSPFASADRIGAIPEGELVTVEDRHGDYFWVEARDHHFGWIQQRELEPVVPGSLESAKGS